MATLATRRAVAALAGLLALPCAPAWAQRATTTTAELLAAAPRGGDVAVGNPDAPVTVVEYTSLLCPYCGAFRRGAWPVIARDYVATGKVRWIVREYAVANADFAAAMLARCEGLGKAAQATESMFADQRALSAANASPAAFMQYAATRGFFGERLRECLADRAVFESVDGSRKVAADRFGVAGTPTFFVDGERLVGSDGADRVASAIGRSLGKRGLR